MNIRIFSSFSPIRLALLATLAVLCAGFLLP
jgi:hypothetical protein